MTRQAGLTGLSDLFAWLGTRARLVLVVGLLAALLFPGAGGALSGTLPFWVVLLFALAMAWVDISTVARNAIRPRRLLLTVGLCLGLMIATPALYFGLGTVTGLPEPMIAALVYQGAAPPLGSAAAFCLLLGLNAAFAIEITVIASLLAPLIMPLMVSVLLDTGAPIDGWTLMLRLAAMIGAGTLIALVLRHGLGPGRITRNATGFDGLSAVIMVLFLFPLFEGLPARISADPARALGIVGLVLAANLGAQALSFFPARHRLGHENGGAAALMWGNRNAALARAALPGDPVFTLYVALYQIPMYFTPLLMRRLYRR